MKERKNPQYLSIGVLGTAIWVSGFAIYIVVKMEEIVNLAPNEMGDFLAGTFAPLAFLWLVVGYLLQSRELGLQYEELVYQVEATKEMAAAATDRQKRETDLSHLRLVYAGGSNVSGVAEIRIEHRGETVQELKIGERVGLPSVQIPGWPHFDNGSVIVLQVPQDQQGWIRFDYLNLYSEKHFVWVFVRGGPMYAQSRLPGQLPLEGVELEDWLMR